MQKNVGVVDMVIRFVIAAVLFYIGFADNPIVSGGLSKNIIKAMAFLPLLTGTFRFCPLYALIGMNTVCACAKKDK